MEVVVVKASGTRLLFAVAEVVFVVVEVKVEVEVEVVVEVADVPDVVVVAAFDVVFEVKVTGTKPEVEVELDIKVFVEAEVYS